MFNTLLFNLDKMPASTDKKLVTNWNLMFLKFLNYSFTYLLLWSLLPSGIDMPFAYYCHCAGSLTFGFVSMFDLCLAYAIWPDRPNNTFNPFKIIMATLSTPVIIIIDIYVALANFMKLGKQLVALALCIAFMHFKVHPSIPWFQTTLYLDVWIFFFVFFVRKFRWLQENLSEEDQIVHYFKDTCWGRITKHPKLEFIYCATTGLCTAFALQVGKLIIFLGVKSYSPAMLEPGGAFQSYYAGCLMFCTIFYIGISYSEAWYSTLLTEINCWFVRHHKFHHIFGSQYITKHFEHHDVIPLASIGGVGFQENVHRSLTLTFYGPYCGYNNLNYLYLIMDEWEHNFCPAASNCDVLRKKPIHLEHHMNHTIPLGFIFSFEVNVHKFKYDESLWDRVRSYIPDMEEYSTPAKKWNSSTHYDKDEKSEKIN